MTQDDFDPKKEWALIQAAEQSEEGLPALRDYVLPIVNSIAAWYAKRYPGASESELRDVGLRPLPRAVKGFSKQRRAGGAAYKFTTYYAWWAREWIEHELGIDVDREAGS